MWFFWMLLLIAVAVLAGYVIRVGTRLDEQRALVLEASAGIDAALVRRWDALAKLAQIVEERLDKKPDAAVEGSCPGKDMSTEEKARIERTMTNASWAIEQMVVDHPQLATCTEFSDWREILKDTAVQLQDARKQYNAQIFTLNQMVMYFPHSAVAGIMGIRAMPMLEGEPLKQLDFDLQV